MNKIKRLGLRFEANYCMIIIQPVGHQQHDFCLDNSLRRAVAVCVEHCALP